MKIYYVTGISGAGKTQVRKELSKQGYLAFDGDENGLTGWQEKDTDKFVKSSERVAGPSGSLIELYDWSMSRERLVELVKASKDRKVFICGTASNRYELWDMFEKVFCLSIDKKTLVHRLTTRTNNDFGKDPKDLEDVISWHKLSEQTDVDAGAILIDATKPVENVVDEIMRYVK
ncbi:AAA family ATPase [soil metagenome]